MSNSFAFLPRRRYLKRRQKLQKAGVYTSPKAADTKHEALRIHRNRHIRMEKHLRVPIPPIRFHPRRIGSSEGDSRLDGLPRPGYSQVNVDFLFLLRCLCLFKNLLQFFPFFFNFGSDKNATMRRCPSEKFFQ